MILDSRLDLQVVTGVKFTKQKQVIHIQIQQGQALPQGQINSTTIQWVETEPIQVKRWDWLSDTIANTVIIISDLTKAGWEWKNGHLTYLTVFWNVVVRGAAVLSFKHRGEYRYVCILIPMSLRMMGCWYKPLYFSEAYTEGQDYKKLSFEDRSIDLDRLEGPKDHIVTGVRFRMLGSHINLEVNFCLKVFIYDWRVTIWMLNWSA